LELLLELLLDELLELLLPPPDPPARARHVVAISKLQRIIMMVNFNVFMITLYNNLILVATKKEQSDSKSLNYYLKTMAWVIFFSCSLDNQCLIKVPIIFYLTFSLEY
jgi:hypothetical protein